MYGAGQASSIFERSHRHRGKMAFFREAQLRIAGSQFHPEKQAHRI
jgi:hypothetical protein